MSQSVTLFGILSISGIDLNKWLNLEYFCPVPFSVMAEEPGEFSSLSK